MSDLDAEPLNADPLSTEMNMREQAEKTSHTQQAETDKRISVRHLSDKKDIFNKTVSSINGQLDIYQTLFSSEDVLISDPSSKAKTLYGTYFNNQAINDREQFFDIELITLKKTCDELIQKRQHSIQSFLKKDSKLNILTLPLSRINLHACAFEEHTSLIRQLNTEILATMAKIKDRLTTIHAQIEVFKLLREKYDTQLAALSKTIDPSQYNPDFRFDKTTDSHMASLNKVASDIKIVEKELSEQLNGLVSSSGRKTHQDAPERYLSAAAIYQKSCDKLSILSSETKGITHSLDKINNELQFKASRYQEHYANLKDRARLIPLHLAVDTLSKKPYVWFDAIRTNILELPNLHATLEGLAVERERSLKIINKHNDWIKTILDIEDEQYDKLKAFELEFQAHYAPIQEAVLTIHAYIEETKKQVSLSLEKCLQDITLVAAPFESLNQAIQVIGLNQNARTHAQRTIDDITLSKESLRKIVESQKQLDNEYLYSERETLLEIIETRCLDVQKHILENHDALKQAIRDEKKSFNEALKKALYSVQILEAKTNLPFLQYEHYHIEPGNYEIHIHNKNYPLYLPLNIKPISLNLNHTFEDSFKTLYFPDNPYNDDISTGVFTEKRKELEKLNHYILHIEKKMALIEQCRLKRKNSDEIKTIHLVREQVAEQLKRHYRKDTDYCYNLLTSIDKKFVDLEERYCNLQIKNKNTFISDAIQTVESTITHNSLERLSDQDKRMVTQFFRVYVLGLFRQLLEKVNLINQGHLTFFAGPNEINMQQTGKRVIDDLSHMTTPAREISVCA